MQKSISRIADVQVGYQFRGKVEPHDQPNVRVIQIKDLSPERCLRVDELVAVRIERPEPYLVRQGDVLFLSRGHRLYATAITMAVTDVIATGYFFILHPTNGVDPLYLEWYLNAPIFQDQLRPLIRGSHMPLISKADFQELSIHVPRLETQTQIGNVYRLSEHQKKIEKELQDKRAELLRAVCETAARKS